MTDSSSISRGHCPDCGHRGFVLGPRGGLAQNIECGNLACRARFNVTIWAGEVIMAHRIPSQNDGGMKWPSAPPFTLDPIDR